MTIGRRTRWVALRTAYGGGAVGALGAASYALLAVEAKLARKAIGLPTEHAPDASGTYGKRSGKLLHLAVLGDSSATGLGCESADQTPGALLAGGMARDLRRRVALDVVGTTGARSSDLPAQVRFAQRRPVDIALIMIGANDVTHRIQPADAARDLATAVRDLRAQGALVVVGTCPDLGTVEPLLQPLKTLAAHWSRRLARAQAVAVVEAGGVAVSLRDLLAVEFGSSPHYWSADRFHPSPEGYRRVADALLPSLLEAVGVSIPVSVPVSESVEDIEVAATVAVREPGVALESADGPGGAAAAGPGRLARLRRRLPLRGRGAPDPRVADLPSPEESA
ncbi:MAG TPA: SGNH/GDSL hydrolase family protein, partial [Mycobacteriales bacterium]|nr:SGNH/GDSL hydrolase family protein [Mycobacteriales bacterium]